VPQVQYADCVREELRPYSEYVEKQVPRVRIETVEKAVEVPQVCIQEVAVEVPQIQTAEAIRQAPSVTVQEIFKEVPKVQMDYREKVIEVAHQVTTDLSAEMVVQPMSARRQLHCSQARYDFSGDRARHRMPHYA